MPIVAPLRSAELFNSFSGFHTLSISSFISRHLGYSFQFLHRIPQQLVSVVRMNVAFDALSIPSPDSTNIVALKQFKNLIFQFLLRIPLSTRTTLMTFKSSTFNSFTGFHGISTVSQSMTQSYLSIPSPDSTRDLTIEAFREPPKTFNSFTGFHGHQGHGGGGPW